MFSNWLLTEGWQAAETLRILSCIQSTCRRPTTVGMLVCAGPGAMHQSLAVTDCMQAIAQPTPVTLL